MYLPKSVDYGPSVGRSSFFFQCSWADNAETKKKQSSEYSTVTETNQWHNGDESDSKTKFTELPTVNTHARKPCLKYSQNLS